MIFSQITILALLFSIALLPISQCWAASKTIIYHYDELGRVIRVEDSANKDRNYYYDDAGNRTSLTTSGGNQAPVAKADSLTLTGLYSPKTINVLANDTDPDGDPLTLVSANGSGSLSVINKGNGVLEVTAVGVKQPSQSFSYTVSDPSGATSSAVVTVTTL